MSNYLKIENKEYLIVSLEKDIEFKDGSHFVEFIELKIR